MGGEEAGAIGDTRLGSGREGGGGREIGKADGTTSERCAKAAACNAVCAPTPCSSHLARVVMGEVGDGVGRRRRRRYGREVRL